MSDEISHLDFEVNHFKIEQQAQMDRFDANDAKFLAEREKSERRYRRKNAWIFGGLVAVYTTADIGRIPLHMHIESFSWAFLALYWLVAGGAILGGNALSRRRLRAAYRLIAAERRLNLLAVYGTFEEPPHD